MRITIKARLHSDIQKVWDIITDNYNYAWRSDLNRVSVSEDGETFIEYAKNGFPTTFSVSLKQPCERYELDMSNANMSGHWIGEFSRSENRTHLKFTEEVFVQNPIKNLFAGLYLKRRQTLYIKDLKRALGE